MSEQKRPGSTSKEQEKKTKIDNAALGQDMQIEVSTTQAPMHQANAIRPVIERDNDIVPVSTTSASTTNSADFQAMTDEEAHLTTRARRAGDALSTWSCLQSIKPRGSR